MRQPNRPLKISLGKHTVFTWYFPFVLFLLLFFFFLFFIIISQFFVPFHVSFWLTRLTRRFNSHLPAPLCGIVVSDSLRKHGDRSGTDTKPPPEKRLFYLRRTVAFTSSDYNNVGTFRPWPRGLQINVEARRFFHDAQQRRGRYRFPFKDQRRPCSKNWIRKKKKKKENSLWTRRFPFLFFVFSFIYLNATSGQPGKKLKRQYPKGKPSSRVYLSPDQTATLFPDIEERSEQQLLPNETPFVFSSLLYTGTAGD